MITEHLGTFRLLRRDVRLLVGAYAIMGFAYVGLYTVLFNLYLVRLGFDIEFVGQANAAGRLGFALCGLPAGLLGTRFGVRRLMIVGEILAAAGLIGVPCGEYVPVAFHASWIVVTFFLSWVGAALFFVNVQPFVMAVTSDAERRHAYSSFAALTPLAAFLGSLAAGVLPGLFAGALGLGPEHPAPYRYPLMLAGALFLLTIPLVLATRPAAATVDSGPVSDPAADRLPLRLMAVLAGVAMLASTGNGAAIAFFNVYLDDGLGAPTEWIGTLTAVGQLMAVPAAALMPIVATRLGNARTYITFLCGTSLCLLPLGLVPWIPVAGLAFVGVVTTSAIAMPLFTMHSQGAVPERWRSLMSGAAFTFMGCGWALTALLGGYAIERYGYATLFLGAAVTTAAGAVLFALHARTPRGGLTPAAVSRVAVAIEESA